MTFLSVVTIAVAFAASGASVPAEASSIYVAGPWTVQVSLGEVAATLPVAPPEVRHIRDEKHPVLPVFNEKTSGWRKGTRLKALITEECTATGLLTPETLVLKPGPGGAAPFKLNVDYRIDPFWATVGRIEGGAIGAAQEVYVDYRYIPDRLDSIVAAQNGSVRLAPGVSGIGIVYAPSLQPGEKVLANVWVPGTARQLGEENLFPIDSSMSPLEDEPTAVSLLPKTFAKLRGGKPVTIVTFGDSVTNGGGVNQNKEDWYQSQFLERLRERYPKSEITWLNAAWGGASSKRYMDSPRGSQYDYVRDVLEPKADLVTIEFVNDAYLSGDKLIAHYAKILADIRGVGSEVALITPHLVRPDWMGVDTLKFDDDPRPYVKGLREFAEKNDVALADASALWCQLWLQGIPYTTLLANSINHPDVRGHALFADALMALFPEEK